MNVFVSLGDIIGIAIVVLIILGAGAYASYVTIVAWFKKRSRKP